MAAQILRQQPACVALAAAALVWVVRRRQRRRAYNAQLSEFDGQVRSIFITGAASGIGLATAHRFAKKGWFVGMYDLNEAALEAAAKSVKATPGCAGVASSRLDLVDAMSCGSALAHFLERSNGARIDVLFNCAGLLQVGAFEAMDLQKQLAQVRVNVDGLIQMTYSSVDALKRTPHSRIVNMSSVASVHGLAGLAVYSATKHAVRALTESWSLELGHHGIAVTDVNAPPVATPMVSDQAPWLLDRGYIWKPQDVADVVFQAATDDPSTMHFSVGWATWTMCQCIDVDRMFNLGTYPSFLSRYIDKL